MHVTANSKEVKPGSIFFALKGAKFDGHDFILDAIKIGATQIYAERDIGVPGVIILGTGARKKLGEFASEMAGHPTRKMKMIGVTGTSGKTTTTYLIHHLLQTSGIRCARIGTNGAFFEGTSSGTDNTTPDAITLQKWFEAVKSQGAQAVVMEVSSHALDQDRVWGITWDAACFLNLSREHMDYHPTLEHYLATKALLFQTHADYSKAHGKSPALSSNIDNQYGEKLQKETPGISPVSIKKQIRNLKNTPTGIEFEVFLKGAWHLAQCPLFGSFQVENILSALEVVLSLGVPVEKAIQALAHFGGVPGRMQRVPESKGRFVFVDYAHKPEALEKVLLAIQVTPEEKQKGRKIITVFGCGGDRDKTKRPVMGEIASRLSDFVFVTSDNPRTEDPLQILKEVESGITLKNYQVIPDRKTAIEKAIQLSKPNDIVLIAGKGHEDYQIIGTVKTHFDDVEVAGAALSTLSGA